MSGDLSNLKTLTFDVFGTVVDWRSSVTDELRSRAAAKLASGKLSPDDKEKLTSTDWAEFAQEWRNSYKAFTLGYVAGETEWKDIDAHHHESLVSLLDAHSLENVYSADEVHDLSLVWHRLRPWPDSASGLRRLGAKFVTATLSNGNRALVRDLDSFGNLGFMKIMSAEDWKVYKPDPVVYDGAVAALLGDGAEKGEVAMVAAHLGDLAAARGRGLRTIYVERPLEEDWEVGGQKYEDAKGWVDVWVKEGEGGFEEVAKRLGA
ncbi:haloacid type ii [Colletotrichum truncatum]|uniref:Haloacid type ii n=1 Tax=Colletotrichum truncatum TaxID=5467 RepID=A0ACC3ZE06_COLTU|nr:haloacid type ii [Colletotrichum truncatum]KAF6794818.1 haloacid type ii [Colletotrichum truncatum]